MIRWAGLIAVTGRGGYRSERTRRASAVVARKNSIGAAKQPIGIHDVTRRERVSR
jgi:hypothetical protein